MSWPHDVGFATRCIHAGQPPDPATGAVATPIYQTSTFAQEALGRNKGYEYARTRNPTRTALEANLAAIEGGRAGFAFASGMAAIDAVVRRLGSGDHVVATANVYGGTYRLFERVLRRYGLTFTFVDTSDLDVTRRAITPATKLVFVETPTNPLLRLTDLAAVAAIAHERGIPVAVDNTFASPYLQQPIAFGCDLVIHSTTKYLNGHSDSVGGAVVAVRDEDIEWLGFVQNAAGAILGPMDAWLVLRGTKTLPLRMAQHSANGLALATFLRGHRRITRVYYPGLDDHPQRALAARQMPNGSGGMLAFEVDSPERARRVLGSLRLITLAESLGGVESLASHPASMTHASVPPAERAALGISDALIRISTGIEDVADLIADLEQALEE
jgi:cystathionine gamma-lyase/cystathionine beta-lyase/cystathionine gamma-lyase/homocysteine desulfhydrase